MIRKLSIAALIFAASLLSFGQRVTLLNVSYDPTRELFQDYNTTGSFALASVLTLLALVTLVVKVALEQKSRRETALAEDFEGNGK